MSKVGGPKHPPKFWDPLQARTVSDNNQILHGDQTTREENFTSDLFAVANTFLFEIILVEIFVVWCKETGRLISRARRIKCLVRLLATPGQLYGSLLIYQRSSKYAYRLQWIMMR